MPNIITESRLKKAIEKGTFIQNGVIDSEEGIKYDFHLGPNLLKASFKQPINMLELPEKEKAELVIEPGEVVFVLTQETLVLPNNIQAVLSPKRKLGHVGIMVLGGFCIDPLYEGKLLIGMYNFSSSPFPLIPSKKIIAAIFYELQENEIEEFKKPEAIIYEFPEDLINLMVKYRPISTQNLKKEIENLKDKVESLRKEFREVDVWFKKFQNNLEIQGKNLNEQGKNIEKIAKLLDREVEERRSGENALHTQINQYVREAYKTAATVGAIGALVISLILFLIQYLLKILI